VNIYVGNLAFGTTEDEMRELFGSHGQVESCSIITDRQTGRSRGFGFIVMPDDAEAQQAIDELNGKEFSGRTLTVNQARDKAAGGGGGGGGGRGGGGGGGRRSW